LNKHIEVAEFKVRQLDANLEKGLRTTTTGKRPLALVQQLQHKCGGKYKWLSGRMWPPVANNKRLTSFMAQPTSQKLRSC